MTKRGTRACYNTGCKHDECRAANTKYKRDRRAAIRAGTYAPRPYGRPKRRVKLPKKYILLPPHGTYERYQSRLSPCHDACCREANAAHIREWRAR